jgi:hypothetical protein
MPRLNTRDESSDGQFRPVSIMHMFNEEVGQQATTDLAAHFSSELIVWFEQLQNIGRDQICLGRAEPFSLVLPCLVSTLVRFAAFACCSCLSLSPSLSPSPLATTTPTPKRILLLASSTIIPTTHPHPLSTLHSHIFTHIPPNRATEYTT